MASAFNCVVVGFQALRKIPRISAVLDSAVDFSPGSPTDVQTIRAALALATVIEASLGCLGPSAEYVSRALTIENPEVAPITRLIQDNVQPGSITEMRTGLQTLSRKIAQSGLQPLEYLTAGLAGSLLPARALEIATLWHTRGILIATVKAKQWEQPAAQLGMHNIARGCLPPFVSRATQNIHPVVAGLLGVLSTEIMFEWLSREPHPQHTWRLFNAVFPGIELALRKYRKGAYSPSASSQRPACNRAGFELGAQAIARGIRACSAEAEHRRMTLQQIIEEKVRPYKGCTRALAEKQC